MKSSCRLQIGKKYTFWKFNFIKYKNVDNGGFRI